MQIPDYVFEFYENLDRQGPGSYSSTEKALKFIENYKDKKSILDLGCGAGRQTLDLLDLTSSDITAVDLHQNFLDYLSEEASAFGFNDRVKTLCVSIDDVPMNFGPFDIVWSEGALYNIGLENGLEVVKKYLMKNGYLAFSELCWHTKNPSPELIEYWEVNYPDIDFVDEKIKLLKSKGYEIISHFSLPETDWIDNYYNKYQLVADKLLNDYPDQPEVEDFVNECLDEMELYYEYKEQYGYEFFILQLNY